MRKQNKARSNEPNKEIYKSRNEFHQDSVGEIKRLEKQLADDSLLGTCRILRSQNRLDVEKIGKKNQGRIQGRRDS